MISPVLASSVNAKRRDGDACVLAAVFVVSAIFTSSFPLRRFWATFSNTRRPHSGARFYAQRRRRSRASVDAPRSPERSRRSCLPQGLRAARQPPSQANLAPRCSGRGQTASTLSFCSSHLEVLRQVAELLLNVRQLD